MVNISNVKNGKLKTNQPLLCVKGLKTEFRVNEGSVLRAIDGVDISIQQGEIHGLVGESGCGKTVTALSILNLIKSPGVISNGKVLWCGVNLLGLNYRDMQMIRGKEIAMIFQNPQASLNPLYTVGNQMSNVIRFHTKISKKEARYEAIKLLHEVQITDPKNRLNDYPHQLSGGMCQRVMIAMALSCQPKLLIADEPTAALDVTIQAQILDLLLKIRDKLEMSILLVSHNMGVIARMCDRISVMYLGKIVEESDDEELFTNPKHPYTQALLKAILIPDPKIKKNHQFTSIKGDVPDSFDIPFGCRFRPRCPEAFDRCREEPILDSVGNKKTKVACWLYQDINH